MNDTAPARKTYQRFRLRLGWAILIIGSLLIIIGVNPAALGLDRSSVTGFVQISVYVTGLALLCSGGYLVLNVLWNGNEKSIIADIGIRLVATGFVIATVAGLADIFGFGSHIFPMIPSFGPLQSIGVMIGEAVIALGFILFIPNPRKKI